MVADIFIRHYNKPNDRYRPLDVDSFVSNLFEKLAEYTKDRPHLADLSEQSI